MCLKRKKKKTNRSSHYLLHINAIKGQNVCTAPESRISPQEISVTIMRLLVVQGTLIKNFGKMNLT